MGDKRRARRFAELIQRTFPHRYKVADVAGGNGELAFLLHQLGKEPTVIDPCHTTFPRWVQREMRERAEENDVVHIEYLHKTVEEVDLKRFDLIVAMHPDEATEPAMRAAIKHGLDFAIVPCCAYPLEGRKQFGKEWIRHLASLAPDIKTTRLDITGPNTCLWRSTVRDSQPTGTQERQAIRLAAAQLPRVRLASDIQ